MTGSWWRLLAAFLLILTVALLRGQDSAGEGIPGLSPSLDQLRVAPVGEPILSEPEPPLRYRIGYPLGPYPVGPDPILPHPIVFPKIVQAAGIIFSGRVTSIARASALDRASSSKTPASTAVTFRVEHALRGTSAGQSLTIHEWAGLWTKGERYRVGERVLLFLYLPSKLGLTSPVAAGIGRFTVNSKGQIVMTPRHLQILESDPILGGKTLASYDAFALAVNRSSREQ